MPITLYVTLAALLAGFAGGWATQGWRWDASLKAAAEARYSAVVKVRETDADLQRMATVAGSRTEAMLTFQREKSRAIDKAITASLAGLPQCVVPGAVVGLLNDATRAPDAADPGSPGGPGPAQPAADPARPAFAPSSCSAELAICARNYAEVAIPNAIERDELRRLYNEVKDRVNRPP